MSRLRRPSRALAAAVVAVAVGVIAPGVAVAAPPFAGGHAAKKKKKKPKPLTATVSGTFTIRQDFEGGFGNDNGPNWQQLKVEIKKAEIPFKDDFVFSAASKESVTFTYHAEASTSDRSYHAGCDSETRTTDGTWTGLTYVSVRQTKYLDTKGKSKRLAGWKVTAELPDAGIELTSKGSYNDWESILMTNCQTFEANTPLGVWSPGFAQPDGVGTLADDNRSVPLLSIDTAEGQTGSATGKLKFSKAPR